MTINAFKYHIDNHLDFLNQSKLIIAISGGLDSVVLAYLCQKINLNIVLAHCNFSLRDQESDTDEAFVVNLAKQLGVAVFTTRFNTNAYVTKTKLSVQMAARELRYNWFELLSKEQKCDYVLTAHHADDNLETFLINLSRGTGLEGLTGIPQVNHKIVRPLLPFSRADIKTFAQRNYISWREDSSNASVKYIRNKLRHDVIPELKKINPKFLQNFNKTQGFLQGANMLAAKQIATVSQSVLKQIDTNTITLDINKIKALKDPKHYLYELLKSYNFTAWHDILNLLNAQAGKQIVSPTHRLIKDRTCLILTKKESVLTDKHIDVSLQKPLQTTPIGELVFTEVTAIEDKKPSVIYVDKNKLANNLVLRKWQEGDYFYPLGMTGKKKLSKYLKDEKLSLLDKEHIWLLCSDHKVVWVVNKRADHRFRVSTSTLNILKIELKAY